MGIFGKEYQLLAPISGKTIFLGDVPDAVFAQKLAGDGVAIEASGSVAVAPADGQLIMVFETNHAFAIRLENGLEVLVHIGVDTVKLKGEGFKRLVEEGECVKAGTPVLEFNRDIIKERGFSYISPILITNMEVLKSMKPVLNADVKEGIDVLLSYKMK